jgi:hypothetical protein
LANAAHFQNGWGDYTLIKSIARKGLLRNYPVRAEEYDTQPGSINGRYPPFAEVLMAY